jgi:hypothetical protein
MAEWKTTFYPAAFISDNDTRVSFLQTSKTKIDNAQFIDVLDTVSVDIVADTDFHISGH